MGRHLDRAKEAQETNDISKDEYIKKLVARITKIEKAVTEILKQKAEKQDKKENKKADKEKAQEKGENKE
jgi:hypothetical protein